MTFIATEANPRFLASSRGFRATAPDGDPTLARRRALARAFDLIDELGLPAVAGEQPEASIGDQLVTPEPAEPERVSEAKA